MKLIQVIIAFVKIYLFVGVLFFIYGTLTLLARYSPDVPSNVVAQIITTSGKPGANVIEFSEIQGTTALSTLLSRDKLRAAKIGRIFSSHSEVIFVTYEKIKIDTAFVPLGFTQLYQLQTISDASGAIVYERKADFLDVLLGPFIRMLGEKGQEVLTILARPPVTSYTVTISTQGMNQYEN